MNNKNYGDSYFVKNKTVRILVTGASGYIGGRLIQELDKIPARKYKVISMVRRPVQFKNQCGVHHEIRYGDALKSESLESALKNIDVAFYLIHSLAQASGFVEAEIQSAKNFIKAAEKNKVKKIIYLGGLFDASEKLSPHLDSRKKVGEILRSSSIPCISFRASIILGSGSISFELIRSLTERLPIMITPKWVRVKAQPISIRDVLAYLVAAIDKRFRQSEVFEIGGEDQVSYSEILKEYARQRKLKRAILPVPFLSLRLSSLWMSFVTPIYAAVGMKLIESVKHATVVNDLEKTQHAFSIRTMSMAEAIRVAIKAEQQEFLKTHWASAYSASNMKDGWLEKEEGNRLIYTKQKHVLAGIDACFYEIQIIGAKNGWYYANFLWRIRGYIDLVLGGPGHRRGRKHAVNLHEGDFIDWWRVEQFDPPNILRLHAEMKLPGHAWLEFELKKQTNKHTDVFVTAIFEPSGLVGRIYWYALYPIHFFMFNGLINAIKKRVE